MSTFVERLEKLKSLGMTEYQARVYIALLDYDATSANQIPAISRVPRTKIYGIMRELHEKGLVQIIPERPLKYRAVPLEKFLKNRVGDIREKAQELKQSVPELAAEFQIKAEVPQARGNFEVVFSRRNCADKLKEMMARSKKCVLIIGTEKSPGWIARVLLGAIKDRSEEGVNVICGFPTTPENSAHLARIAEFATVRHIPRQVAIMGVVIDNVEAMLVHRIPDDENSFKGDDLGLWTDDEGIVRAKMSMVQENLDWSVDFQSHNAIGPVTRSMIEWINTIGLDPQAVVPGLATTVGEHMAKSIGGTDVEKVVANLDRYWQKGRIGGAKISSRDPLKIQIATSLDCQKTNDDAESLCKFVQTVMETVLRKRTGELWTVLQGECPTKDNEFCTLTLSKKKA